MNSASALALAVLLLLGNAFFVAAEFALVSARRTQIEPRAEAGNRFARTTLRAMENMSEVIAVNQLGITVCSLVLGAVAEPTIAHLIEPVLHDVNVPESFLHPLAFTVGLSIVVFLHVVMGEMIPKNIALAGPDRAALVLGTPVWAFVTVLRPVIRVINAVARVLLRLVGVQLMDEVSSTYTREEVAALVEESRGEGLLRDDEYDRLAGALGFTERTVSAVLMRPDTLTTVARLATVAEVEDVCAATGYSRFPVTDAGDPSGPSSGDSSGHSSGTVSAPIGYLHIKDVLETDEERRQRQIEPRWIRPLAPVRSSDALHDALETLQRRGSHMAIVADDDGTYVGLATLEDVIEELVGEIRDAAHLDE